MRWWWGWQGRRARVTSAELRSNLALNLSGGSSQPMFCASFSYTSSSPPLPLPPPSRAPPHHHHHHIITNIISITRPVPQGKGNDDIDFWCSKTENAYWYVNKIINNIQINGKTGGLPWSVPTPEPTRRIFPIKSCTDCLRVRPLVWQKRRTAS